MKKTVKSIVSILLILSMLLCATVPALAAGAGEEYISELRLVYAEDYNGAKQILADGEWQKFFSEKPEEFTKAEKRAYLDGISGVALGSDAFFPFGDNIERAHRSGVTYIAEPGGSIRDDAVIDCCNKYGIAMAFTGMRLFHH